jgi:transcriptional regulator with XRE-family HTH domain
VTSSEPNGKIGPILDVAELRRLRLKAGLSTRRMGRAVGVSASTIRGLESGANHEQLPLILVARLAEALEVTPQELFARARDEPAMAGDDDRVVEAALQSRSGVTASYDLATCLGWTLERVVRALDALDQRLEGTGTRLHRNSWQQRAIRPATDLLSDDQQQALHRLGPSERGLTQGTARVLLAAARGELDDRWLKTASNGERVALQSLLKQRLVLAVAGHPQLVLSPDAVFGLDPERTRPPDRGALLPIDNPPEAHPGSAALSGPQRSSEQLGTPD